MLHPLKKSCFEALISDSLYRKLMDEIPKCIDKEVDTVRVYKMNGRGSVSCFGNSVTIPDEEVII